MLPGRKADQRHAIETQDGETQVTVEGDLVPLCQLCEELPSAHEKYVQSVGLEEFGVFDGVPVVAGADPPTGAESFPVDIFQKNARSLRAHATRDCRRFVPQEYGDDFLVERFSKHVRPLLSSLA